MSSTRISPRRTLMLEVGLWHPVPLYWISKKTIRVVVFHRRVSSHLFYTPYVFSQCQTRVKLNHFPRWKFIWLSPMVLFPSEIPISPRHFPPRIINPHVIGAVSLLSWASFRMGLARSLGNQALVTDTLPRVTMAEAHHEITINSCILRILRLPRTRCLAGYIIQ